MTEISDVTAKLRRCRQEGFASLFQNPPFKNPYHAGYETEESHAFMEGYSDARKFRSLYMDMPPELGMWSSTAELTFLPRR